MSSIAPATTTTSVDFVDRSQVAVIVPTFRAASHWKELSTSLIQQQLSPQQILIVDTTSNDGTDSAAEAAGFQVIRVAQSEFNNGGTRQLAARHMHWAKILIYLTQDAISVPGAFDALLTAFTDPAVGAAYGRQLPLPGAGPIEAHARHFNYPAQSSIRTQATSQEIGIKAAFCSNSFAAYRVTALQQAGGFPTDVIMAEDALVAARMLLLGWKTAYVANACVFHSHAYNIRHEFRRYFDTGVSHARAPWLRQSFGGPYGEGWRFALSEVRALLPRHFYLIPYALLRTAAKYIGYQLGLREAILGKTWSQRLSCHTSYWDSPNNSHHNAR